MEVHHHPHVEKKRFKEYLLEGLMIFIAVSLGFIAENVREHFSNREKEHHFIRSIITDLEKDTAALNDILHSQQLLHRSMDSALQIPIERLRNIDSQDSFYHYFLLPYSLIPTFMQEQSTIQQLRSGGFAVFKNKNAVDSISSLYTYFEGNLKLDISYTSSGYWDLAHAAEKIMILPVVATSYDEKVLKEVPNKVKVFINPDEASIQQLYNVIANYNGGYSIYILDEMVYKNKAVRLIKYLKNQYSIN